MNKDSHFNTIGIDLGGTKLNVGLVDENGCLLFNHKSLVHPSKEPNMVILDILEGIDICLNKANQEAKAVGIGIAAQVDRKGVVCSSPNLGWYNFPLKKKLEEKLDLPIFMTNDVRAATWGEWKFGSGKGIADLIVLFVGTGVGGGIISGEKVILGCNNIAGELGHITIVHNGRKCHCPNKGCLEAYAGGWAIAERAKEAIQANPKKGKRLLSIAGSVEKITAKIVSKAYAEGDSLASKLVEDTGKYLASGVVSVVNIFNPCCLILGGGVIEGIPDLVQIVRTFVKSNALEVSISKLKIIKSTLGHNAAVIGSANLALKLFNEG
ncbi:MAG: ROK family protein [Candidatus Bathyarchaeota archaeon]